MQSNEIFEGDTLDFPLSKKIFSKIIKKKYF